MKTMGSLPMNQPKEIDEVLAEVRRAKTKLLEQFGHDLSAMVRDARVRQAQSGHSIKK